MGFLDKFSKELPEKNEMSEFQTIIDNLNNILNTKKDFGYFLNDFGVRDLGEYSSHGNISQEIIEEIRKNIEKFERRVEVLKISEVKDTDLFHMSFDIECVVKGSTRSMRMIFDSVFNSVRIKNTWENDNDIIL